jgi:hypothetical protein
MLSARMHMARSLFLVCAALPPSMVNMGWEYPAQLLHPGSTRLTDSAREAIQAAMQAEAVGRPRPGVPLQTVRTPPPSKGPELFCCNPLTGALRYKAQSGR